MSLWLTSRLMSTELSKTYDPAEVEKIAYQTWLDEKCFHAEPTDAGDPYCIVIPPPNVTGALHLGHAINNTLQDILIRKHRMDGHNTVWIPGIDHAGIATQAVVEKQLKEQENKTRHDVGREGLVERIWKWKEQYGDRILSQLQRLGCSCDWDRTRFTLDEQCAKAVRETFFKLFKDGLIYRGKRLVNWDIHLNTSISDDELYDEEVQTSLWPIRYPIEGTDQFMTVATTRPETMLADTAVAVHPDDPRWNWAIGKQVRLPLTGRLIPIIDDPILVDMKFGTGCVKVTPAHDPNDYAVWERQKGKIAILNLMTPDGRINEADPSWARYAGLKFPAARKKVVEDLIAAGNMTEADIKPHLANVKHSDRSKTAVEPYLSDQWFVKMAPLAEPALKVVRNGTIKFYPERHAQQYLSWLGEKRDWPISRQLWWGHRIPVWRLPSPVSPRVRDRLLFLEATLPGQIAIHGDGQGNSSGAQGRESTTICIRETADEIAREVENLGFVQDPDVLDTWFSSALWPHSTLGWPDQTPDMAKWYPTSVLLTGRDIITLWVARMVMMGMYNMGQTRDTDKTLGIPFFDVAINPTILDGKGERMSKSKGNGVDPVDVIDTHGADALRFTLATMATETQDVRMPVKKDAQGRNTSDKFDLGRNFCTKLWNAFRFAISNLESEPKPGTRNLEPGTLVDRWILSRFARTVEESNQALAVYRFDVYAKACYDFFWRDFCDWYVEAIKPALQDPQRAAATSKVLLTVLDGVLRLMHPIIPFITETLWWKLNEIAPHRGTQTPAKRLIKAPWPVVGPFDEGAEHVFPRLQEIIGAIRNVRNDYKVDSKKPVIVSISPPGEEAVKVTRENKGLIELLALCTVRQIAPNLSQPSNSVRTTANTVCEIFVENVIDPEAEKQRLAKQIADLKKTIAALEARLNNPGYMAKAPPNLVQQTNDQLAAAKAELAKLEN